MNPSASSPADRKPAPVSGGLVDRDRRPDWLVHAASLQTISYVDEFTVDSEETASPEQWARAMFGNTPSLGEVVIWRGLLGIRLSKGASADTVAGWRIGATGDDWLRLEASSWFLSANLIVRQLDRQVSLSTLISYDRFPAKFVWTVLSAVHRLLVPRVLTHAASLVAARSRSRS